MIFSRMDFSNETVPVTMFPNSTVAIRDVYQFPDFEFVIVVSISVLGLIGNLATILKIALDKKLHTPTFLAIDHLRDTPCRENLICFKSLNRRGMS